MERQRLLKLLIDDPFPYIKWTSDSYPFINTCVLDSLLAALQTTYMKYTNIENLLNCNDFFRKIMILLKEKKYNDARHLCVKELSPGKVDLYGHVKEYFPLFAKLACAEITYNQNPPNDGANYKEIPSIFMKCGDVKVLGNQSDPNLILVHGEAHNVLYCTEPPLQVDDEKKRIFELQFLLLGKEEHMTMCFQYSKNEWYLYDNDPTKPSFQPFEWESHVNYVKCLAGYVNITQANEDKLGIPETGETAGARLFSSDTSSIHSDSGRSVEDMEVDDQPAVAILETRQGLPSPKPFYENQPEISPIFSNQEQLIIDIEMPSCSSSDSD
ncbi:uncharacterized protein LOC132881464 isoform X1 [Neoarius graeffei]|uniref:uncharacterized protein LOC132881464 isoform X1 n=2 Tax=Neoarius graeffei TaxID=443677 RepID=UPI00298D5E9B|nr:uncharacterized protein LOC132881464 isoform X1 [Neoarius graeffei]XP_060769921.1 uncharacterized protein LOC132881464 isoform X1 [Neoarius graeffei]XP_060769922.1 uncharacterized protein LOC132881464 isoform X1 [Neoarius graeffei]